MNPKSDNGETVGADGDGCWDETVELVRSGDVLPAGYVDVVLSLIVFGDEGWEEAHPEHAKSKTEDYDGVDVVAVDT